MKPVKALNGTNSDLLNVTAVDIQQLSWDWECILFSSIIYHSSKISQALEDKADCSFKRSVTDCPVTTAP
jgi:hypothetical protein